MSLALVLLLVASPNPSSPLVGLGPHPTTEVSAAAMVEVAPEARLRTRQPERSPKKRGVMAASALFLATPQK
jgi:hypothetical protein